VAPGRCGSIFYILYYSSSQPFALYFLAVFFLPLLPFCLSFLLDLLGFTSCSMLVGATSSSSLSPTGLSNSMLLSSSCCCDSSFSATVKPAPKLFFAM
jgi:hypothetical protein